MEYSRLLQLIDKMENKTASPEELEELDLFYKSFEHSEDLTSKLKDEEAFRENLHSRIMREIRLKKKSQKPDVYVLWKWISVAASVLLIIGAGLFYYKQQQIKQNELVVTTKEGIAPGHQGATLTLGNGKKISLIDVGNGTLVKEAGVVITKSEDGQLVYQIKELEGETDKINTLSTANGETYRVRLPDGSLVWLNAASSLSYTTSLINNGRRIVRLQGEGYFEVAKDQAHPFIVQTDQQEVEVLGTHFNICAYPDDPEIKTTLAEGSVKITAQGKSIVLQPNQQAILNDHALNIRAVDAAFALAWKNGFFFFDHESLEGIMEKVARWYDVEVEYKDLSLKSETFTGTISRFEHISKVFNMLERTEVAEFKIEGKKIIIDKRK